VVPVPRTYLQYDVVHILYVRRIYDLYISTVSAQEPRLGNKIHSDWLV
jgi:hypothetical protein